MGGETMTRRNRHDSRPKPTGAVARYFEGDDHAMFSALYGLRPGEGLGISNSGRPIIDDSHRLRLPKFDWRAFWEVGP